MLSYEYFTLIMGVCPLSEVIAAKAKMEAGITGNLPLIFQGLHDPCCVAHSTPSLIISKDVTRRRLHAEHISRNPSFCTKQQQAC
jgi:hypothetical protein